ncbi:MAG TPA: peptidylprolyl isomerase [Candidatus Sulfotelmatobacter sp.]|nr:peptidylprolyl isomerase [Candidatus Sulfotelmatobacter sp.]
MKRILTAVLALAIAGAATRAIADSTSTSTPAAAAKPASPAKAPASSASTAAATSKDKAIMMIDAQIAKVDKSKPNWKTSLAQPTVATFDPAKTYYVRMVTNKGPILIKFLPKVAPMHVTNFIYLTRLGFYDGLSFHRVIPGFMAQGGDPIGNGTGGPGYGFGGEFDPAVKHDGPGKLSMANAGPGTDGSQFFLTFVATPWLDGKHTLFGEVVEGMETLKALEKCGSPGAGKPTEPLKMTKVTIEVK